MTAETVSESPIDLPGIRNVLRAHYGIAAADVAPLTGGLDRTARIVRVAPESGVELVLRMSRGEPGPAVHSVPRRLHLSGVDGVVAPLPDRDGRLFVRAAGLIWSLYPFVDGVDGWTRQLSGAHWRRLGEILRAMHGIDTGEFGNVPRPGRNVATYDVLPYWDERLRGDHGFAATWQRYRPGSVAMLEQMRALRLERAPGDSVFCHGDLHPGNILVADAGIHLIDWDDVLLAPKERDFIFVPHAEQAGSVVRPLDTEFLRGYGISSDEVDWVALTYHRCERVIQDVLVELESAASGDARERAAAADLLHGAFSPGGAADAAREAARHLPAELDLLTRTADPS